MSEIKQYCTFYIDDLFFGVDVLQVQEVLLYQEMTHIPLSSNVVSGLINLRGETVTAIDLRRRLGLEPKELEEPPMNVIVSADGGAVSLLVDEIGDVIEPEEDCFEQPPETLKGLAREMVKGVYKLENTLMLELDAQKVANFDANVSA